jgi:hypothetical protein
MVTLIQEYRRYPTVENARRLREYFEHNPWRVWAVRNEFLHVLAAAGVRGLVGSLRARPAGLSEQYEFVCNWGNALTRELPFRPQGRATPPTQPSVFACRVRD